MSSEFVSESLTKYSNETLKFFDPKTIRHGLYKLYWKSGGHSLASVGSHRDGTRWYAPTNWINVPGTDWESIEYVEVIKFND